MLAGQKDKRNLLVACSESDQNLKKQADSAVFVEQLMKSERNQIREAVELCRRCRVEVLGSVIVGSDSY